MKNRLLISLSLFLAHCKPVAPSIVVIPSTEKPASSLKEEQKFSPIPSTEKPQGFIDTGRRENYVVQKNKQNNQELVFLGAVVVTVVVGTIIVSQMLKQRTSPVAKVKFTQLEKGIFKGIQVPYLPLEKGVIEGIDKILFSKAGKIKSQKVTFIETNTLAAGEEIAEILWEYAQRHGKMPENYLRDLNQMAQTNPLAVSAALKNLQIKINNLLNLRNPDARTLDVIGESVVEIVRGVDHTLFKERTNAILQGLNNVSAVKEWGFAKQALANYAAVKGAEAVFGKGLDMFSGVGKVAKAAGTLLGH